MTYIKKVTAPKFRCFDEQTTKNVKAFYRNTLLWVADAFSTSGPGRKNKLCVESIE